MSDGVSCHVRSNLPRAFPFLAPRLLYLSVRRQRQPRFHGAAAQAQLCQLALCTRTCFDLTGVAPACRSYQLAPVEDEQPSEDVLEEIEAGKIRSGDLAQAAAAEAEILNTVDTVSSTGVS